MQDISPKAVTTDDYSSLFATFHDCSPVFALFETIRTIRDYSLFAIRDYSLFAIRVFQTPMIWGRNSILEIQFITFRVLQLLKWAALFSPVDEKHSFD